MTLRRRFALVAAAAVAIAIVLASGIVYVVVRGELRGRLDDELRAGGAVRAPFMLRLDGNRPVGPAGAAGPGGVPIPGFAERRLAPPRDALGLQTAYVAVVGSDGQVALPAKGAARLPVTGATRAVAAGTRDAFFTDAQVAGTDVRVYTRPGPEGFALQVARPLTEVNRTLDRLAVVLVLVSAGGIALAAALGRLVARAALQPVGRLTSAAEHVAQTSDLGRRIGVDADRDDEISRLARSFNAMLAALEVSVGRQRQLVADASHELRTPLTSLRTNIEVLARSPQLPEDERQLLLADVVAQLDELGALVGDVVELAREEEREADAEDVRFDELVAAAVVRARRRAGAPRFATALEQPCLVRGVPARLDRAVANLLDNAAKWSPAGGEVAVALRDGELTVRDRGPGIRAEDLPHVFERFYRAPSARGMSGSGLGLAIVRQVAELHGGRVEAEAADGGGALLRLTLPVEPPPDIDDASVLLVDMQPT
jgi:two-component system sensor histidine kinase MprB